MLRVLSISSVAARQRGSALLAVLILVVGLAVLRHVTAQEPATPPVEVRTAAEALAAETPLPLSPQEALKQFKLLPGLRIELVACEPEVIDPVSARFDEDGRLWVVEMADYPNGPAPGEPFTSRIRVLTDQDGDGRFEHSALFADGLPFATGLQPWQRGVIVTVAGQILYLRDTDHDGRADQREVWCEGFVAGNPQLRANHPRLGLDNHIHVAGGLSGGEVRAPRRPELPPVNLRGRDLRIEPRSGRLEAVAGNGQFGLTEDEYGRRFTCTNRNPAIHVVMEDAQLTRNPLLIAPPTTHDVAAAGEASRLHPLSRAWTTSNLHAHQFTAACGVEIYRGDALPQVYRGSVFTCDPTANLVHAEHLQPAGATFTAVAAAADAEFLATADEWFRPVDLQLGPDGALYVVDMYRAVIEHPEWMPDELKQRPDLRLGDDRGRIYRVVASDHRAPQTAPKLSTASVAELVAAHDHPNAWWRETAARLILERQETAARAALEALAISASQPAARVQALATLDGLDQLSSDLLVRCLSDGDARVQEQAVLLSIPRLATESSLHQPILNLADSTDARVRFQVALALADIPEPRRSEHLARIAVAAADDVWTRRAVACSVGSQAGQVLRKVLAAEPFTKGHPSAAELLLVRELAYLVGAGGEPTKLTEVLEQLAKMQQHATAERSVAAALVGLGEGLRPRGATPASWIAQHAAEQAALLQFLNDTVATAAAQAQDAGLDDALRQEAVALLRWAGLPSAIPAITAVLQGETSAALRESALQALAAQSDTQVAPLLLELFPTQAPAIRRVILDALIGPADRAAALLDAIEGKQLTAQDLDVVRAERLLKHPDPAIAGRAQQLLASAIPADRQEVIIKYRPALALQGNPRNGRKQFEKNCATCHKVAGLGVDVGPDISDSRTKTTEQLLLDILHPNRAIDADFVSYSVVTTDGLIHTGLIAGESAAGISIKAAENKVVTIPRAEIEQIQASGKSLMPEGLEKNLNVQDLADLLMFIKNWRYLPR